MNYDVASNLQNGIYEVSSNISADLYDEILCDQNNDPTDSHNDEIISNEMPSTSLNNTSLQIIDQLNKNNAILFLFGNK